MVNYLGNLFLIFTNFCKLMIINYFIINWFNFKVDCSIAWVIQNRFPATIFYFLASKSLFKNFQNFLKLNFINFKIYLADLSIIKINYYSQNIPNLFIIIIVILHYFFIMIIFFPINYFFYNLYYHFVLFQRYFFLLKKLYIY